MGEHNLLSFINGFVFGSLLFSFILGKRIKQQKKRFQDAIDIWTRKGKPNE